MTPITQKPALFIHDHCFLLTGDGKVFSEGKITDAVFERYIPLSSHLVILSRARLVEDTTQLVAINSPNLRMAPVRGTRFSRIFGPSLFHNLAHLWREIGQARVVVLRLPCLLSLLVAPILCLRRVPYIVELVGVPSEGLAGKGAAIGGKAASLFTLPFGYFLHHLTRFLTARAIGAIYVTQFALQDQFPTRGLTAAASNVELPAAPISPDSRKDIPLNIPVKIGLIGTLNTTYKGIDIAIRAISLLAHTGLKCHLHILGSGDAGELKSLASDLGCADLVHFDGIRQGGLGVANWLDELDLYIQPSRAEGLPRALVEALARGLPAVATRISGIPELLEDPWLIAPEDPEALADRLRRLILDPDARAQASAANARRAVDYSAPVLKQRRSAFFNSVADLLSEREAKRAADRPSRER